MIHDYNNITRKETPPDALPLFCGLSVSDCESVTNSGLRALGRCLLAFAGRRRSSSDCQFSHFGLIFSLGPNNNQTQAHRVAEQPFLRPSCYLSMLSMEIFFSMALSRQEGVFFLNGLRELWSRYRGMYSEIFVKYGCTVFEMSRAVLYGGGHVFKRSWHLETSLNDS